MLVGLLLCALLSATVTIVEDRPSGIWINVENKMSICLGKVDNQVYIKMLLIKCTIYDHDPHVSESCLCWVVRVCEK